MDEGLSATGRRVVGYGLKWGEPAFIRSGGRRFEELFAKGAFARSIAAGNVLLCVDHDRDGIAASQQTDTLTLVEDDIGLRVEAVAIDSVTGDTAIESVRAGYRRGLSVGFENARSEWRDTDSGRVRLIVDCDLIEISVCRDPAYKSSELYAGRLRIEAFEARTSSRSAALQARLRMQAAILARGTR